LGLLRLTRGPCDAPDEVSGRAQAVGRRLHHLAFLDVKAVILAGGVGSRLAEETVVRPKPMVEIGDKPILWHIMKIYSAHGITDFVICLGYKGYVIKEYFANYQLHTSDLTFDLAKGTVDVHRSDAEPWRITLVDTGEATMTGGRLRRVMSHLDDDFCMTYGDGVADIDIGRLVAFHREQKALCTVTAVQPPGRFGMLDIDEDRVHGFEEKPQSTGRWMNGGFFVCSPLVGNYLGGDDTIWEQEPLGGLARDGELAAYRHTGFWHAMDTVRDRVQLEELWRSGQAPWRVWP
jgi:glucose-1-phosphate cytidylyltransferase